MKRCVTYDFYPEFTEAILSGRKQSTIRPSGARHHAREGDELHLYTSMRTKPTRLLMKVPCLYSRSIYIRSEGLAFSDVVSVAEDSLEVVAVMEGFASGKDMLVWFDKHYGLPQSNLTQIRWAPTQATEVAGNTASEDTP